MHDIEVLVIEDDVRVADVHCRFLEKIEGYKVIAQANTGEEALDWLQIIFTATYIT